MSRLRVLALEAYYGGSHRAFLDGWRAASEHTWTVCELPAYKWKWRMRHAAQTFAEHVRGLAATGHAWDVLFCSSMLDLAAFRGLSAPAVHALPSAAYYHENQLTYPVRHESERDYHFPYTNMTTALAATSAWFNSSYNRDSFCEALPAFLKRMPDFQPTGAVHEIRAKARIEPPGIVAPKFVPARKPGPLRILWAARWEHDKQPGVLFDALDRVRAAGATFRLGVVGERFRDVPEEFASARQRFADEIDYWGFQPTRAAYETALQWADLIVSTAAHEFFGLSVVEAAATGAVPLLPWRLAYPEVFAGEQAANAEQISGPRADWFYDGTTAGLADKLLTYCTRAENGIDDWAADRKAAADVARKYDWAHRAPALDAALAGVAQQGDANA